MSCDPLNLTAGRFSIKAEAGDVINFTFRFTSLNTTGYTWQLRLYAINAFGDGPTGSVISTLTTASGLTHTPGATSTLAVSIPSATTSALSGSTLWLELVRTDVGFVRTFGKGPLALV